MIFSKILSHDVTLPDEDKNIESDSDYEDDVVEFLIDRTLNPPAALGLQHAHYCGNEINKFVKSPVSDKNVMEFKAI